MRTLFRIPPRVTGLNPPSAPPGAQQEPSALRAHGPWDASRHAAAQEHSPWPPGALQREQWKEGALNLGAWRAKSRIPPRVTCHFFPLAPPLAASSTELHFHITAPHAPLSMAQLLGALCGGPGATQCPLCIEKEAQEGGGGLLGRLRRAEFEVGSAENGCGPPQHEPEAMGRAAEQVWGFLGSVEQHSEGGEGGSVCGPSFVFHRELQA